jgi:hypothetical protein
MYPLIDLESRSTNMHGKKGIDRIYDCSDRTLHAFLDRDSLTGKGGEPPCHCLRRLVSRSGTFACDVARTLVMEADEGGEWTIVVRATQHYWLQQQVVRTGNTIGSKFSLIYLTDCCINGNSSEQ